jgi:uncharacterized protein (TIGR02001 family)
MNKKLLVVLVGALAAGTVNVNAQAPAPAPAPAPAAPSSSWTVTPSFASQYMFRGVRLGGPSFQPAVEFDSGPVVAGVWSNFPMADKVVGQSDPEFDIYGSYKETINDSLNFVTGFTLYTYPNADKKNGFYKRTFEPSVAVNYTVGGVTLTPKIYYDIILDGPTYEFNAAYALPLKDAGTELDFTGTVGGYKWAKAAENTSPDLKNYGNYWLVGVSAPFQIVKDTQKLVIGWAYTKGSDNFTKQGSAPKTATSAAVGRGVVTVSYAITF